MNVNDRGTKKFIWTSIMLPEHMQMLEEMWKEQEHEDKPVLDEQQVMENNGSPSIVMLKHDNLIHLLRELLE